MIKIKRSENCAIVYDEDAGRGIAFPNEKDTDVNLYVAELQKLAKDIKLGIILVRLRLNTKSKFSSRPLHLFLNGNDMSVLQEDKIAIELYEYYFENSIALPSSEGVSYFFCK